MPRIHDISYKYQSLGEGTWEREPKTYLADVQHDVEPW